MTKPKLSDPLTIRIPVDILGDIEKIAEAADRTRSWIIVRALRSYLLNEGRDILANIHGREQIAAGNYEDMGDVIADMDRIINGETN